MGEPVIVALQCDLDIREVESLYAQLKEAKNKAAEGGRKIILDAVSVNRMDASGAQCLAAFLASAQASGIQVEWGSSSFVFPDIVELLGLAELLGL